MVTITLKARKENIEPITEFIDRALEERGCPLRAQMQIRVAIDELVANISQYAYPEGTGEVTVSFDFDETTRTAELTFTDSGIPYDPLKKEDPDVTLSAAERPIGGLGIFLVRKTMDAMQYRRENGKNILTIRKRLL